MVSMTIDPTSFRRIMGQFATGVTIVTTRLGEELHGSTANAFTSVSIEPLLVLVCLDKKGDTHGLVDKSGVFAVNILGEDQEELSRLFATKGQGHNHSLRQIPHRYGVTGAPIIEGVLAYLDCVVAHRLPGGDHTIFVGEVKDGAILREAPPLIFFRGRYARLAQPL
jgi:flavin reductase (DIM6/NTAB) family NADH-FMN oxidoreductase RutF